MILYYISILYGIYEAKKNKKYIKNRTEKIYIPTRLIFVYNIYQVPTSIYTAEYSQFIIKI